LFIVKGLLILFRLIENYQNILLQNSSSYSIPDEKLLADELLTKANEFMSVFYDSIPLPNDPLYQFRYPGPGICAAIINIAVACEIYVKGYVRRKGNPIYEKILENHRDFTVPVKDYLDYIIKDITGFSVVTLFNVVKKCDIVLA